MNRSHSRWLLLVAATVIWLLAIYPGYYVVHKPLTPLQFRNLANALADMGTWLALLAVATIVGSRLNRRLVTQSLLEHLVFSVGLGLIAISLLTFALSLLGLLYRWLLWILLGSSALALRREFLELGQRLRQVEWPRPRGKWQVSLSLFVVLTLLLAFPLALTPPVNWDSLLYHLVGPEHHLQAHRLTVDWDNYLLFTPVFAEMLFTAGMGLKGDVVPRLIHFGYLWLTLAAIAAFATRYWEGRLGLVATALFLSIPTAVQVGSWSYVDFVLVFYHFGAIYALLNWLLYEQPGPETAPHGSGQWLLIAGLFCGAAMSTKYNGLTSPFVLAAVLVWALGRRRLPARRLMAGGLVVAGFALLVAAPSYVRNLIVTGNPIYPMIWGGRGWDPVSAHWLKMAGPAASLAEVLVLPWRLTVLGKQGTVAYDATLSPLFLTLIPLLLAVERRAPAVAELLLVAAVGYLSWIAQGLVAIRTLFLNGRWLLPSFPPLSLLCAYTLDRLHIWDRESFSLRRVLMIVMALTLGLSLLGQAQQLASLNPWLYLAGFQSRDDYQAQYTAHRYHQTINYINENLAPTDRILFLWEGRSYGCRIPHQEDPLSANFARILARYGSPQELADGLRREGFSHLLVNQFVYPWIVRDFPITEEEMAAWEIFRDQVLTADNLVHSEGDTLQLFRVPAAAP